MNNQKYILSKDKSVLIIGEDIFNDLIEMAKLPASGGLNQPAKEKNIWKNKIFNSPLNINDINLER